MLRAWALTSAVWDGCQTALVVKLWDFIISLGGPSQVGRGAGKAWEGASANSPRWVQTGGSACSEREASSCKHEKVFIQLFKASAKSQTWGICLVCLLRSPLCIWVLCRHTGIWQTVAAVSTWSGRCLEKVSRCLWRQMRYIHLWLLSHLFRAHARYSVFKCQAPSRWSIPRNWLGSAVSLTSGNPYPFASFTHLSYTRDMTWISYLEKVMTSYTRDMTWISQMQII